MDERKEKFSFTDRELEQHHFRTIHALLEVERRLTEKMEEIKRLLDNK